MTNGKGRTLVQDSWCLTYPRFSQAPLLAKLVRTLNGETHVNSKSLLLSFLGRKLKAEKLGCVQDPSISSEPWRRTEEALPKEGLTLLTS